MSMQGDSVSIAYRHVVWVCTTPLGKPVVPEVYMMYSRSSSLPPSAGS